MPERMPPDSPSERLRRLAGEVVNPAETYRAFPSWRSRAVAELRSAVGDQSSWTQAFETESADLALPAPSLAESWDVWEYEQNVRKAAALLLSAADAIDPQIQSGRRISPDHLRQAIANTLAEHVKAYDLSRFCDALGLVSADEGADPNRSKRVYAKQRMIGLAGEDLMKVGRAVVDEFSDPELDLLVELFAAGIAAKRTPGSFSASNRLAEMAGWDAVQRAWTAASLKLASDPEGAITAARTMLESVCKHICDERGASYESAWDLSKLYKAAASAMEVAPEQHSEQIIKQILSGTVTVVGGLAGLRNNLSDAHGRGKGSVRPAARHARLAVNSAYTVAGFLIDTHLEKPSPVPPDKEPKSA